MDDFIDRTMEGMAALIGLILVLGFLALEIGGITYRKDCAGRQGAVTKQWTIQWFVPIPYLLRPSGEGCELHAGTRVALSSLGIFPIKEKSAGDIARDSTGSRAKEPAYYAGVYAVASDIKGVAERGGLSREEGEKFLQKKSAELHALTPYAYVAADHEEMLRAFDAVIADDQATQAALRHGDTTAARKASAANLRHVEEFYAAAERIRQKVVAHGGA